MRSDILASIPLIICSFLMSACSPINSQFSCNATASDSCMTIEQVDAMTRFADSEWPQNNLRTHRRSQLGGLRVKDTIHPGAKVWLSQPSMNRAEFSSFTKNERSA